MYKNTFLKQSLFILILTLTAFSIIGYLPTQAENYLSQTISEKIGPELSPENIFSIPYKNREVIFVGQIHYLPEFQDLKKWLVQEALTEKLVLILEGLPRDLSWESTYRKSVGGHGKEPIYGMEDGASLLVEAGTIFRYISLNIIENYGINCPEHIVNISSFEPIGEKVWDGMNFDSLEKETKDLVIELDTLIKSIRIAPDLQAKFKAFDLVKKQLIPITTRYSNDTWAEFYGIYAFTALDYAYSMPSDLRNLTIQLLKSKASIPKVREWLLFDSVYREEHFAQSILWVMDHTDDSLPTVVLVGRAHLIGLLKALVETQTSI